MSLHRYFKIQSNKLPDPNGPLSKEIPAEAIKTANDSVEQATKNSEASTSGKQSRGKYAAFTGVQQAQMAKYAIDNGNKAAIEHYSEEFCVSVKESSLSTWKSKYYEEVKRLSENLLSQVRSS